MASKTRSTPAALRLVSPITGTGLSNPPEHLAPATAAWWRSVLSEYDLADHHLRLLQAASEAWDRCQQARIALAENGLVFTDPNGTPKARPEVAIERDSRVAFARCLRELDLDVAPPPEPRGRPPGLRSNRR
jgi:phage terminase small subunit